MNLRTKLVAAVLASTSIVACGGSGNSDEDQISKAIVDLNQKMVSCLGSGDCDDAVFDDLATGTAKDDLVGAVTAMQGVEMDATLETKVSNVAVDGETATADACNVITIKSAKANGVDIPADQLGPANSWAKETYDLEKVDGSWKVSGTTEGESGAVEDGVDPCAA